MVLAFHPQQRTPSLVVGPQSVAYLQSGVPEPGAHIVARTAVRDVAAGEIREFLWCMTCHDAGHETALELFAEDAPLMCPVEAAERIHEEMTRRMWKDTVGYARQRGAREAEHLRALLPTR